MITSILIAFSIAAAPAAAQSGTVAMDRPVVAQAAGAGSAAPGTRIAGSGSTNMGGSGTTTPQPAPTTPQPAPGPRPAPARRIPARQAPAPRQGRTRLALVAPPRIPAQLEPVEPAAPWAARAARPARCKTRRARNEPQPSTECRQGRPPGIGRPFVLALRATYRVRAGFGAVTRRLGRAHEGPSSRHPAIGTVSDPLT